jgi:hypothetical protein
MAQHLPNVITTPTQEEMFNELGAAYVQCMGTVPTKEKVCLLMAQSAFETGWWKYMHCYNIGNVKSVAGDGRDFTYFKCWELVPEYSVKTLQAHPKYGHLVSLESVDGLGRAKIWLAPDHPGCRFRAYKNLKLGVFDHFMKLLDKYTDEDPKKDAWSFVVKCDPASFVHALKLKGYFTGDEATYVRQVTQIYHGLCAKKFDTSKFQVPSSQEEDEIRNWRVVATMKGVAEVLENRSDDAPDVS